MKNFKQEVIITLLITLNIIAVLSFFQLCQISSALDSIIADSDLIRERVAFISGILKVR